VYSADGTADTVRPSVRARVSLSGEAIDGAPLRFRFHARVDYSLPISGSLEDAQDFAKWAQKAVKKCAWAQGIVEGRSK